jgi:hypothetical protein
VFDQLFKSKCMGLYHFLWEGKERSVSVNKMGNTLVSLRFLDSEISRRVTSHSLIRKTGEELSYLNKSDIASLEEADRLLKSIETSLGRPMERWL